MIVALRGVFERNRPIVEPEKDRNMVQPISIPTYLALENAPVAVCFMPRSYYHGKTVKRVGVQKNGLCFIELTEGITIDCFKRDRVLIPIYKTDKVVAEKTCGLSRKVKI